MELSGYPGSLADHWIEELEQVLQRCIAIGLLVILPSKWTDTKEQCFG